MPYQREDRGGWWFTDIPWQGKRIRKRSPINNKRAVDKYERQIRDWLLQGLTVDGKVDLKEVPTYVTFSKEWFETFVVTNNKPSSQQSKRVILRRHLVPFFGAMRLNDIGVREIERFKANVIDGRSPKTVNNILSVLRRSLVSAVEWGLIDTCPPFKWLKAPKPDFDFFVREESDRLLNAVGGQTQAMICVGVQAGLRRGELLALRWEDVDLVAQRLLVRRSYWRGHFTAPKNSRTREVPLTNRVRDLLAAQRHLRGELIFCRDDGSPLSLDQIKRWVPYACQRAGLRRATWHVLRHSFASQLAMAGVPLRIIQELLGHQTIEMTLRYAHLCPTTLASAVAVLDGDDVWLPGRHHSVTND